MDVHATIRLTPALLLTMLAGRECEFSTAGTCALDRFPLADLDNQMCVPCMARLALATGQR